MPIGHTPTPLTASTIDHFPSTYAYEVLTLELELPPLLLLLVLVPLIDDDDDPLLTLRLLRPYALQYTPDTTTMHPQIMHETIMLVIIASQLCDYPIPPGHDSDDVMPVHGQ